MARIARHVSSRNLEGTAPIWRRFGTKRTYLVVTLLTGEFWNSVSFKN
jgi:hypothetical protein